MLKIYEIITYISGILYYVSTTINPILYHIMSHKFREAFKDTLTRCCGISKGRVKRTYSVLSRSRNAQDSTDYSISKDEYLPSNSHSTVKTSLESRNFSNSSFRETNRNGFSNGDGSRRPLSVVVNSRYGEVRTVVREERKNIFRSPRQRSSKLEIPTANHGHRKRTKRRRQNERLLRLWNFLVCHAENNLAPQAGSPFAASPEAFNMSPVDCRSLSNASDRSNNHSNISNSSLKDVDRRALEDELSTYMEELKKKSGPE